MTAICYIYSYLQCLFKNTAADEYFVLFIYSFHHYVDEGAPQ